MKKLKRLWRVVPVAALLAAALSVGSGATSGLSEIVDTLFGEGAATVDIVILLTILSLLPSIIIMFTGFTRIIITLSFMRNALGMQQTPPNQVLVGLALFLTFFIMSPTITEIYNEAYVPYAELEITQEEFLDRAVKPARTFMINQVNTSDMDFFLGLAGETYETVEEVPLRILLPAFLTSEMKTAFKLGFVIYISFIVIDMVVASTLMAMGMMMLPPAMISLPFKVLLFVAVDGWQLVIGTLMKTFN